MIGRGDDECVDVFAREQLSKVGVFVDGSEAALNAPGGVEILDLFCALLLPVREGVADRDTLAVRLGKK